MTQYRRLNIIDALPVGLKVLGSTKYILYKWDEAYAAFNELKGIYNTPRTIADLHLSIGYTCLIRGLLAQGVGHTAAAREACVRLGDVEQVTGCDMGLGLYHKHLGQHEAARHALQRHLQDTVSGGEWTANGTRRPEAARQALKQHLQRIGQGLARYVAFMRRQGAGSSQIFRVFLNPSN